MASKEYEYDVFISHAVEDKADIANELVARLKEAGLKVWYSSERLRVGYGVDETIKEGLNKSRYGIAVLTHNYFKKNWPKKELYALWSRPGARVLPVWHNISEEEIREHDPILVDNYGLDTKRGLDYVVEQLVHSIKEGQVNSSAKNEKDHPLQTFNKPLAVIGVVLLLPLAVWASWYFLIRDVPSNVLVQSSINKRITSFQQEIISKHETEMAREEGIPASDQQVKSYYERYMSLDSYYRNQYHFNTGYAEFNFKKNVEPAMGIDLDVLSPYNNYEFELPDIYVIDKKRDPPAMEVTYVFINSQPVAYEIIGAESIDGERYQVEVKYENHIRYLSVKLTHLNTSNGMKRKQTSCQGFLPKETYQFDKEENDWVFVGVK